MLLMEGETVREKVRVNVLENVGDTVGERVVGVTVTLGVIETVFVLEWVRECEKVREVPVRLIVGLTVSDLVTVSESDFEKVQEFVGL